MRYFEYFEPKSVGEACQFLSEHQEGKVLSGGVSLMVLLKNGLIAPSHLVNIKTIPGLGRIEWDDREGLRIGGLNRHRDILYSPLILKSCPILAEAASRIGSPPIRNLGTIGGNIAHAEPSADFPPALIALNASLTLTSTGGERQVPVEGFFTDFYENVLGKGELLTSIRVPPLPPRAAGTYITLEKVSNSAAIVGVAAVVALDEKGICTYAGVGLGGVASIPLKVKLTQDILVGEKITETQIDKLARAAQSMAKPIPDVFASAEYRKEMVYVLTRRALQASLEKALAM